VVVPIYNEEELIVKFHEAVANAMEGRSAHNGKSCTSMMDLQMPLSKF